LHDPACVVTPARLTVVGGTPNPSNAAHFPERDAVVAVVLADVSAICSGVLVAPDLVLTAEHCLAAANSYTGQLSVVFGESIEAPTAEAIVVASWSHSELDIAALRIAMDDCAELALDPLPLLKTSLDSSWIGTSVTLAGYGVATPSGTDWGRRLFATETIVAIEDAHIVVAATSGTTGACIGDSGGPLLVSRDGRFKVVGVLQDGDPSCLGEDYYVRVDRFASWIAP
jgi:secreted trypsin-like serine protease